MKKLVLIIFSLILIILAHNPLKKYIYSIKFRNEVIDFLNNDKKYDFVTEGDLKAHIYAKTPEYKEFNITEMVDNYIDNVEICIKNKINSDKEKYSIIDFKVSDEYLGWHSLNNGQLDFINRIITNIDVDNYNSGIWKKLLINEISKSIEKRVYSDKTFWYIKNDNDKIIELPYNAYIDFKYTDKKNIDIDKVVSLHLNNKQEMLKVEYLDHNGKKNKKEISVIMQTTELNGNRVFTMGSTNQLYYDITQEARLTFGQHDYDIAEDLGELSSARTSTWSYSTDPEFAYPDDSTEELREEEYYQSPILTLYEGDDMRWGWLWLLKYKTGEIKYATSLYKMYKIKTFDYNYKDKITYLPYEGIETIEELKERYLNDTERYEADKKWLYEPVELSEEEKKEAAKDKYKWEPINK